MVDNQKITVTNGVGTVFCLALAMSITGVTGDTTVTDPCRTKSFTGRHVESVQMLKEVLTGFEVFFHAGNILYRRCGGRVTCFLRRS